MPNSAEDTGATSLPTPIGRYEAFLQIGAGGMGRVYLASERGTPRTIAPVVIKQLRHDIADGEEVRAMFMDEARIALRLDHPNVVKTRDLVAASPDYYLVMEFLEGRSLLQVLNRIGRAAMPVDVHLWILTQVLAGLEYAHGLRDADGHALGLVHRDVSPSNIQLCYSGEVKLLDFGIAQATGALAAPDRGTARGKIGYASPEQCLGKDSDPRSDLYAVGVMLWEAIAQRLRSPGETWQSVLRTRVNGLEPSLESVRPGESLRYGARVP
jgi:serine/threonine-protein kinase